MIEFFSLIIILFLFLLSAFWSGSETALTSLSKHRIKKLIALNKHLSVPLGQWLKSPYYLLTLLLVGNTVTNLILSELSTFFAERAFSWMPRELLEILTWLIVTGLLIVFGEVTPKLYSRCNAEKVTLLTLPLLSRLVKIFTPLISPFIKPIKLLFPRLNLVPVSRLSYLSLEEVRALIEEANSKGILGRETSMMLDRAAAIGELEVSKIMTPVEKIEYVALNKDEDRFLDMLVETGRSRVPVFNPELKKFVGFVHIKDLLWAWKSNGGHFSTDLIRPPYFINKSKKVYDLLKEFKSGKTHMAFVQDELGNLTGLITLEDLLEELLGEILDEYDVKKINNK
jgi:putative hemolysin